MVVVVPSVDSPVVKIKMIENKSLALFYSISISLGSGFLPLAATVNLSIILWPINEFSTTSTFNPVANRYNSSLFEEWVTSFPLWSDLYK